MAFTDVEMAILSQLAYKDIKKGASLYSVLQKKESYLNSKLGSEYKESISSLMTKVKNKDYTIVKAVNDKDDTGFAAFAIKDPNNEVTVACRGTEGFSMDYDSRKDVLADMQLAFSMQTNQQEKMKDFVEDLVKSKADYDGFYFTGHSLGGNLAMYGAITLEDPKLLKGCRTFNAPGFNADFLKKHKSRIDKIEKSKDKMIAYQNECDGVSECFDVPGKVVVLECEGVDALNKDGIVAHGLNKLIIDKKGKFKKNHTGMKDSTIVGSALGNVTNITDLLLQLKMLSKYIYILSPVVVPKPGFNFMGFGRGLSNSIPVGDTKTIKITPAELRLQAVAMEGLEAEFAALFANIGNDLNCINSNWSANLARNFSGKITSAQKQFAHITQMLEEGAKAADTCANTFESVDSALAKIGYI